MVPIFGALDPWFPHTLQSFSTQSAELRSTPCRDRRGYGSIQMPLWEWTSMSNIFNIWIYMGWIQDIGLYILLLFRIYIYTHIFISYWTCYLDVNYRGATIWSPHVFQPRCWRSYAKPCRSSNKSSKHTVILGWLNCSIQAGGPGVEKRVVGTISMFQQIREKSCP